MLMSSHEQYGRLKNNFCTNLFVLSESEAKYYGNIINIISDIEGAVPSSAVLIYIKKP